MKQAGMDMNPQLSHDRSLRMEYRGLGYTLHDLRRTFATGCATLGVDALVVDKCLNHQPKNLKGVARIYNRYAYAKEKEAAWKLWSNHVASLAKGRHND
jgi:integrase